MKTNRTNTLTTIIFSLLIALSLNAQTNKTIDIEASQIIWKGYKVTGDHEGTLSFKEGFLTFENDVLTGGELIVDMNSINTTDKKGFIKKKIDNHLKSDDFFDTKVYPEATLKITNVKRLDNEYQVTGDITIKGTTNTKDFKLSISDNTASSLLQIDRSKYNVKYRSPSFFDNLKKKAIYDEFDLKVTLVY